MEKRSPERPRPAAPARVPSPPARVNLLIIPYSLHLSHFRLKLDFFYSGPVAAGRVNIVRCRRRRRRAPLHRRPRLLRPPPSLRDICGFAIAERERISLFSSSKKISLVLELCVHACRKLTYAPCPPFRDAASCGPGGPGAAPAVRVGS